MKCVLSVVLLLFIAVSALAEGQKPSHLRDDYDYINHRAADNVGEPVNESKDPIKDNKEAMYKEASKVEEKAIDSAIAKKCPNGVEKFNMLINGNPFDNKGKCYYATLTAFQLLGRNKSIVSVPGGNPLAIVDFGKESASVNFFRGVVKGRGAYQYKSVSSSITTVHKLDVVSIFEKDSFLRVFADAKNLDADSLPSVVKKVCPKGAEPPMKLFAANPFDNTNRCVFTGMLYNVQMLSRNKALFSLQPSGAPSALLDFGKNSAPVLYCRGYAKGRGAFQYVSTSGALRTVHKLDVIKIEDER